ncbi:MAG: hypothetical protein ACFCU4_03075 [Puniceicoccaceae bacterium]
MSSLAQKFLRRYPVAVGLGILLVFLLGFFIFRGARLESLIAERDDLETQVRRMEINVQNLKGIKEHTVQLKEQLVPLSKKLIKAEDQSLNLDFFYRLEQDYPVQITPAQQSTAIRKRDGKNNPWALKKHGEVRFSLAVNGPLREVLRLMNDLGTLDKFIAIRGAQITPSARDPEVASATLSLDMLAPQP